MKVDLENRVISGCRFANKVSSHGFYFSNRAMDRMALHYEGKAVNDRHGENSFEFAQGIMQGVQSHGDHGTFNFHVFDGEFGDKLLKVASKGEVFEKAYCFSIELPKGGYTYDHDENDVPYIDDVDFVMPLAIVEFGGNTNGISQGIANVPDFNKKEVATMDLTELKTKYPDQLKLHEVQVTESVKAESAEQITKLTANYEGAVAKIAEKDTKIGELQTKLKDLETATQEAEAKAEEEKREAYATQCCSDCGVESPDLVDAHKSGALTQDAFDGIMSKFAKKKKPGAKGPKIGGDEGDGDGEYKYESGNSIDDVFRGEN